MIEMLQTGIGFILALIFALSVLIAFHEFGHYWVAKKCNVKILRFSIGFGKPIWWRTFGRDNSEFVIGAIPLGGYVKMLDEREGNVPEAEKHRAFNGKPLGQRFAIVLAGPMFNFIFAVLAYWLIYLIGITGLKPVVGDVEANSMADRAGFQVHDEIIHIDAQRTPTWSSVVEYLAPKVIDEEQVIINVRGDSGYERDLDMDLAVISIDEMAASGNLMGLLGIEPERPDAPAIISSIMDDGAAMEAGLLAGDEILAVNDTKVTGWGHWVRLIRANPDTPMPVTIRRDDYILTVSLTPRAQMTGDGERIGYIGAATDIDAKIDQSLIAVESYPVHTSFIKAVIKTGEMSLMTLQILGKMITGQVSVKNLSGPIAIAEYAGRTAQMGIVAFLGFLAVVSISLGVLNLLPIPLLDGGHLTYYIIEFFKGSPVSDSAQLVFQQVGIVLLIGLMSLALYNDILRLVG